MEQLVSSIVEKLGIDAQTAERVIAIVMNMFQEQGGEAFDNIAGAIPGAQDLMSRVDLSSAGEGGGGGGGLLGAAVDLSSAGEGGGGGLLGAAMGMLGGGGNPLMDTLAKLQAEGLSMDQAKDAGTEIVGFAKQHAGEDAVNDMLAKVPGLSSML